MERLTERNADGSVKYAKGCYSGCGYITCSMEEGYQCNHQCEADVVCKLANYEDAEEQGLLLRLPVAIGSDVYFIPSKANYGLNILHNHEEFNKVYHQKIARLHFTESGWYAEGNLNLEYGVVDRLFVDKLYKETWFLTKEEAEQALVKMKGV